MKTSILLALAFLTACAAPRATLTEPRTIAVFEGDSVRFENTGPAPRQLRSDCAELNATLAPGQSFVATLTKTCHLDDGSQVNVVPLRDPET